MTTDKMTTASSNIRSFGTYTPEAQAAERAHLDDAKGGLFHKLEEGDNVLRIFPPLEGMSSPFVIVHQHFIKVPWLEKGASFNCPRQMEKKPCAACQFVAEYSRDAANKAKLKIAKECRANARVFAVVAVRRLVNGEPTGESVGPKLWAFSDIMHKKLLALLNSKTKGGNFLDPSRGFDIIITKTGEGMDTEYSDPTAARELTPLGTDEQVAEWLENYPDLATLSAVPEYDETLEKLGKVPNAGRAGGPALPAAPARAAGAAPARGFGGQGGKAPAPAAAPARRGASTIQQDLEHDPDADPDAY